MTPKIDSVVLVESDGALSLRFVPTGRQGGALRALTALGPHLRGLPDGATLEIECAYLDDDQLKQERLLGLHRYLGTVKNGTLAITEAFPVAGAGILNAALALSAQVEAETSIYAGSPERAKQVLAALKTHPHFQDNRAVREVGRSPRGDRRPQGTRGGSRRHARTPGGLRKSRVVAAKGPLRTTRDTAADCTSSASYGWRCHSTNDPPTPTPCAIG